MESYSWFRPTGHKLKITGVNYTTVQPAFTVFLIVDQASITDCSGAPEHTQIYLGVFYLVLIQLCFIIVTTSILIGINHFYLEHIPVVKMYLFWRDSGSADLLSSSLRTMPVWLSTEHQLTLSTNQQAKHLHNTDITSQHQCWSWTQFFYTFAHQEGVQGSQSDSEEHNACVDVHIVFNIIFCVHRFNQVGQ